MPERKDFKFVICANPLCLQQYRMEQIPKECPNCHQPWNKHTDGETITDVIYNLLTRRTDKGYMEADPHGWVKGEELPWPDELRRNVGEPV